MRTLAQMRDRVRGDLGLRDSSFLTDQDLEDSLNEAQDIVATETRWYRTLDQMGVTAGVKEYALPLPVSGRCIQIEEIIYDTLQLMPVTMEELSRLFPFYRTNGNGRPQFWYPRGNSGFGLHYTPDITDPDILTVIFVAQPPRVTAPDDNFYIPHGLERLLIVYAKMLASEKDAYGEGARRLAQYQQQWAAGLRDAHRQVNDVAERLPAVMGGDGDERGFWWW